MSTILIVEDEPDILLTFTVTLKMAGYDVIGVGSAEEALIALDEGDPDLILLDLRLPGMDGWMFLERVRALGKFPRIPVIVASANASVEHASEARSLGCRGYLIKPFAARVLLDAVKAAIADQSTIAPPSYDQPSA